MRTLAPIRRVEVRKADPLEEFFARATNAALAEAGLKATEKTLSPRVRALLDAAWKRIVLHRDDPVQIGKALEVLRSGLVDVIATAVERGIPDLARPTMPSGFALAWGHTRSAALVTAIDEEVRETLRRIVTGGLVAGNAPMDVAWQIQRHVGLLPAHSRAVDRYAAGIAGKPQARKLVKAYADRLRELRSTTIARTELLTAHNYGATQGYEYAIRQGSLPAGSVRLWLVTPSDRTCPTCLQMTGQRAVARMGEPFDTPWGKMAAPPAHPSCRCAVSVAHPDFLPQELRARFEL